MSELIETLGAHVDLVIAVLIFIAAMTHIIARAITTIATSASRERSRREIAAYVAEGSISPEQGERLIRADVNSDRKRAGTSV